MIIDANWKHLLRYGHRPRWEQRGAGKFDPIAKRAMGLVTVCVRCCDKVPRRPYTLLDEHMDKRG